jgi:hypothetical protein
MPVWSILKGYDSQVRPTVQGRRRPANDWARFFKTAFQRLYADIQIMLDEFSGRRRTV